MFRKESVTSPEGWWGIVPLAKLVPPNPLLSNGPFLLFARCGFPEGSLGVPKCCFHPCVLSGTGWMLNGMLQTWTETRSIYAGLTQVHQHRESKKKRE